MGDSEEEDEANNHDHESEYATDEDLPDDQIFFVFINYGVFNLG